MAPNTKDLKMLRVVVREDFSKSRCDQLLDDIKLCMQVLDAMDPKDIEKHNKLIKSVTHSGKNKHGSSHYKNEKHSLQGKSGKTHAIC